jgi:uracil phosphoribosyltransferase
MLEAVTELFPEVAVGYIGLERDEASLEPQSYYRKLPPVEGGTSWCSTRCSPRAGRVRRRRRP